MKGENVKDTLVTQRNKYSIKGGKILVFGDLHLSSTYRGKHKNYTYECYWNMDRILDIVKEEKPSAVFFLGDIVGVSERNLKDRQFLMRVAIFFGTLYNITKGNVYAVKGNHDIGDFSDFDFLVGLGYIKNPKYVDYYHGSSKELRFHFVNYGDEGQKLDLSDDEFDHVVLGHANYYIDGVTTWYKEGISDRIELKYQKNLCGVSIIFSGHIHVPSKEILYSPTSDGSNIGLFYLGSPSRTAEKYDDCWYLSFYYDEDSVSTTYEAKLFGLTPYSEVFYEDETFVNSEDQEAAEKEEQRVEVLNTIIQEIFSSRLATGDLFAQIDRISAATDVSKEIAKQYLRMAIDGGK